MRKKFGQPFPTLYFRDKVLSIPGYTFEKVGPSQRPVILANIDRILHVRLYHGKIQEV